MSTYQDFINRLKLLIGKQPELIAMTLSNIFAMRLIGNKTHGDLAEIAIAEFVNQYMYDFRSVHVGKDLYRAKTREEDIHIINEVTQEMFPVSLKAYGAGPLQLSTDKTFGMFTRLEQVSIETNSKIDVPSILSDAAFAGISELNILPLIYDEKGKRCNILIFKHDDAVSKTQYMVRENAGRGRKHPVYRFYDNRDGYICEVRYGGPDANALQRGLWTHTAKASGYFDSITGGWIDYSGNPLLVELFSHALVSSSAGQSAALKAIDEDIARLQRRQGGA